jgi:hypothetical protein
MADLDIKDQRVLFIADYLLKVTKQRGDKFMKPYSLDDTKKKFDSFFENKSNVVLFIFQGR